MSNNFFVKFCFCSTKSKQIKHVQFVKMTKFRSILLPKGNNVEATFDFVEKSNRSPRSIRQCYFDVVAGVDGALGISEPTRRVIVLCASSFCRCGLSNYYIIQLAAQQVGCRATTYFHFWSLWPFGHTEYKIIINDE